MPDEPVGWYDVGARTVHYYRIDRLASMCWRHYYKKIRAKATPDAPRCAETGEPI